MAETLGVVASIIAVVQITKSTVDLVAEIYLIIRDQRISCPEFAPFQRRLEQVHKRAEELRKKEVSNIVCEDYSHVQQWLKECHDFLEKLKSEGKIVKYLRSRDASQNFAGYHQMIDQCYNILNHRSLDRVEEKLYIFGEKLYNYLPTQSLSVVPRIFHAT